MFTSVETSVLMMQSVYWATLQHHYKMAALVDYGSSGSEDEEPISEPSSTSRDQKSLISVLSKQGGGSKDSSKRKGGVRIGLPSLDPKVRVVCCVCLLHIDSLHYVYVV